MTVLGIHASHEQIHPTALLNAVVRAESAGFGAEMSSDHFSPWSARQGQSAYAWSWLGAALQATALPFGVVTAPGQRYHPAIVAQAIATLGAMYPGRFWAAPGTGEASNEHVTGDRWPRKEIRTRRLSECVEVIRALLAGEEVSHDGLVTVDRARLWTLPDQAPLLIGAAVSLETARARHRGRAVGKQRLRAAGVLGPGDARTLRPGGGTCAARRRGRGRQRLGRPRSPRRMAARYAELGFDEIYLHHVGQEQDEFIDAFADHVLPEFAAFPASSSGGST